MRIISFDLGWSTLLITAAVGCGEGAPRRNEMGNLALPLGTEVNGVAYRLTDFVFVVDGPSTFSISSPHDEPILVRELPAGDYQVELLDGWRMEREVSSGFERIDAALTSANPLPVTIDGGATTRAVFSFDTDGLPIHFGPGSLEIQLDISDSSNPPPSTVEGNVFASEQAHVEALRGVDVITGSLTISQGVIDLRPLASLTRLGEALVVADTTALDRLHGLEGLRDIGEDWYGSLVIRNNVALTSLAALSNFSAGDSLDITLADNPALASVDGLENMRGYAGFIEITDNGRLENLDGLRGLIGDGGLWLTHNPSLTSLEGLINHTYIGDGIYLTDNDSLTQLDGLDNIESLGMSLEIVGNDSLASLRGLGSRAEVAEHVSIVDNSALPTCEAHWLIDNITLTLGGTIGDVGEGGAIAPGSVQIIGNDDVAPCTL
jgi:hypothetical protein